jgi:hypothetical protein
MDYLSPTAPRRTVSFESFRREHLSRTQPANDGYDYTDPGVAPENHPTTGKQDGGPQKPEAPIGDAKYLAPTRMVPDDTLHLWTRAIEGRSRPKVPDEESTIVEQVPDKTSSTARPGEIRDFEIMHNWTQNMDHDEPVFYFNVVHSSADNAESATGLHRASINKHVRWM